MPPGAWTALVTLLSLAPALLLLARVLQNDLGPEPIDTLLRSTGIWALRFLALTLLVTPLRRFTGWNALARQRRTLGLAAFGYATLHLTVFAVLDLELKLGVVLQEIAERPYITLGTATWLLMLPLAVTSTKGWIRRLGGKRWARLHRLIYLCAVGGTLHYLWGVKRDLRLPLVYAGIFALLLGYRAWTSYASRRRVRVSSRLEGTGRTH